MGLIPCLPAYTPYASFHLSDPSPAPANHALAVSCPRAACVLQWGGNAFHTLSGNPEKFDWGTFF